MSHNAADVFLTGEKDDLNEFQDLKVLQGFFQNIKKCPNMFQPNALFLYSDQWIMRDKKEKNHPPHFSQGTLSSCTDTASQPILALLINALFFYCCVISFCSTSSFLFFFLVPILKEKVVVNVLCLSGKDIISASGSSGCDFSQVLHLLEPRPGWLSCWETE